MSHRRGQRSQFAIIMLAYQALNYGIERIPPITLASICGMTAIFLGFVPALDPYYYTYDYCLQISKVINYGEYYRMFSHIIMHATDMHLYFNMISLLYKGSRLERKIGSTTFAFMLAILSVLTSLVAICVAVLLENYFGFIQYQLMRQCAIGFSGVLFALKVVCGKLLRDDDISSYFFGFIPVPGKYACWAELLLIQLIAPNSSFLGHLAGILAGLIFTKSPLLPLIMSLSTQSYSSSGNGRTRPWNTGPSQGSWGSNSQPRMNTYTGGMNEEEQFRWAQHESMRYYQPRDTGYGWNVS